MPHTLRRVDMNDDALADLEVIVGFDDDLAGEVTRVTNRLHGLLVPRQVVGRISLLSKLGMVGSAVPA